MNDTVKVTDEEINREHELMRLRDKHSINHRSIRRKVFSHRIVKYALITFISISVLAIIYILVFHYVDQGTNTRVRQGSYNIEVLDSENLALSYDEKHTFKVLQANAVAKSMTVVTGEVSALANTEGGMVIDDFINFVYGTGNREFKHKLDELDKGSIEYENNYYLNRFYLHNDSEEDIVFNYKVFIEAIDNDFYRSSRILFAMEDENGISINAFGVPNQDGNNKIVAQTMVKDTGINGYGEYYLLDPNQTGNVSNKTEFRKYNVYTRDFETEIPEKTWYTTNMIVEEDGKCYYLSDDLVIKAGETITFTYMWYIESSDEEHTDIVHSYTDEELRTKEFGTKIGITFTEKE